MSENDNKNNFTFIDLFAGIGGFRVGLEAIGGKCVFSAEINDHACKMYELNFGDNPKCDITILDEKSIPNHDILCAGFPCQPFSISGKQLGFMDKTRGTLFFDIIRIINEKKPKVVFLENVKNLAIHDNGNTLKVILESLEKLGYTVEYKVLNAKDFGVPQNRERIIIIGSRDNVNFDFEKIETKKSKPMKDFLDEKGSFEYLDSKEYTLIDKKYIKEQKSGLIFVGYLNKNIRKTGVRENTEHLSRVHKQVNRIYSSDGMHPTISSQEKNGRYFIYHKGKVRKITINECFKFFGFPSTFKKIGKDSELFERIGNSVCVPMIKAIGIEIKKQIIFNIDIDKNNPINFLNTIYSKSLEIKDLSILKLTNEQINNINTIIKYEESNKGVFTVIVSSLLYKCLHPEQDVRYHKVELKNGYSGRTFDTKYTTPFLKSKKFLGAMKESGWLTRSLEQAHPFDRNFPGKINHNDLKIAFLNIFEDIEEKKFDAKNYLIGIFIKSIEEKTKKTITIINPIEKESNISIENILQLLKEHFYYKYSSRGASILPILAFYSIYECMIDNFDRFKDKKLVSLSSHYSSDKNSKKPGDIIVENIENKIYEGIEIKFDIVPTKMMVEDAYNKFKEINSIQRYYVLSTKDVDEEESKEIQKLIKQIFKEHGCQIIVDNIFDSLKYYLRLLINTDDFINKYTKNLQNNIELDYEHKLAWNRIIDKVLS